MSERRTECVWCGTGLAGNQTLYCSNACKQAVKYAVSKGEWCTVCHKPMKPRPKMGGFITMIAPGYEALVEQMGDVPNNSLEV